MDYYGPMSLFKRLSFLVILACALNAQAQKPDGKAAASASSALDSELFYQLLLGEINAREGEPGAAYSLLLDAARKTNDGRLYQRAVEIALRSRSGDSALLAARAWKQALPASREANRYVLQILISLNRIGEIQEPLKREVALADPKDRAATLLALPRYFTRVSDKKLAASAVEQTLAAYLTAPATGPAAWTTVGRMRLDAGDASGALDAARRGQAMDALAEGPALLALALLNAKMPQADALVKKHLESAATPEFRMDYARVLLEAQRYAEAALQLESVTLEKPDYLPAWLIRGALELQDGKTAAAEHSLRRYVELAVAQPAASRRPETNRGLVQAYLSLAQIAERKKDFAQADDWLQRIENPEDLLKAQMHRATLLARQGKLEEARQLVRSQPERSEQDARLKVAAEVELLRDNKQYQSAYDVLAEAVKRRPDDFELVYDMAMMAEKLGNLEEMERLLRLVIAGKPEYQHAYNALGFSLSERNTRLNEARQLILKALELAPGDPFITDSLAWVEYRGGNLEHALHLLQEAFKARPDAEIAAHMGEVLWTMGRRDEAVSVWREGAQLNAQNETLLDTLKRLQVKL